MQLPVTARSDRLVWGNEKREAKLEAIPKGCWGAPGANDSCKLRNRKFVGTLEKGANRTIYHFPPKAVSTVGDV